jgi:Protein of unknown function (DUF1592)/Protein of unknown function (DUF1588)/Protein of unknown function (DUF1595)/Protein of unknown function (DUF1585)/Protein of unknown function (DUF1587)
MSDMALSRQRTSSWAAAIAAALCTTLLGCSTPQSAPVAKVSTPHASLADASTIAIFGMRRLTEEQYRNAIGDIFGRDIKIGGRFDPIVRPVHELIAAGAAQSTISASGFEQFDQMARDVASQALDARHREILLPCRPVDATKADAQCAIAFLNTVGLFAYRRPLTHAELAYYADLAERGAAPLTDFYKGLELSLAAMLVAPEFLYRAETAAVGGTQLDSYAKASRLSFFLWNSIPDEALFDAAARGDLNNSVGVKAQVQRMLASPRAEEGLRAFFSDFLHLDRAADLSKDTIVYPRFTVGVAPDLREQALRTIADHLLTQDRSYPDLFTTRKTFLNQKLGLIYQVPVVQPKGWSAYEFPADSDRAGLLGQGAFLALFSHEGRSSATLRGRAIREVLMCQPVPDPPANVDFSGFNDTSNAQLKTARQRMARHATDPACAGCHRITDPLGLPLERYDGIGGTRLRENGEPIDSSGTFEGKEFDGLAGLSGLMAKNPAPTECVARRALEYATGLTGDKLPDGWSQAIANSFAATGYRYRELMQAIILSPQFFAVPVAPSPTSAPAHVATLSYNGPGAQ